MVCGSLEQATGRQETCVEGFPVGDGSWHTVIVERHGFNFFTSVDDGEGWRRNESLASLTDPSGAADGERNGRTSSRFLASTSPTPIVVDEVVIGGLAESVDVNMVSVEEDLSDSEFVDCLMRELALPDCNKFLR